jgi:deoxyadenosine/deoxycytidine kinase
MAPKMSIFVEGTIGVGKTSAMVQLYNLSKATDFSVFFEPLKEWQTFLVRGSDEPVDLLTKFYKQPDGDNLRVLQVRN